MKSTEELFLMNYENIVLDLVCEYNHEQITKEEFENKIKEKRKLYAKQIEIKEADQD